MTTRERSDSLTEEEQRPKKMVKRLVPAEMMLEAKIGAIRQVVAELSANEGSKELYAREIKAYTEEADKLAKTLYYTYTKHK